MKSISLTEPQKIAKMSQIWQKSLGWQPNERQEQQFQQVFTEILLGNRQQNLTRILTPQDFWEKHLWDSISGVSYLLGNDYIASPLRTIDIGTGAGFPGIPLAIAFPHWQVNLLDSTRKKIAFINTLIAKLNLPNAQGIVGRAEAMGQLLTERGEPTQFRHRETYDLAFIRAVSQASVCAEYTLPMVKVGGLVILYRGHWSDDDTVRLKSAVAQLGGAIESIHYHQTPISQSDRHCIYLRKHSPTPPGFPRAVGVPERQPL